VSRLRLRTSDNAGRAIGLAPLALGKEMEKPTQLLMGTCPSCTRPVVAALDQVGKLVPCPVCGNHVKVENFSPFASAQWAACIDPFQLQFCLRANRMAFTRRKRTLAACGIARIGFGWCQSSWFLEAVQCGEAGVEGNSWTRDIGEIIDGLVADRLTYPTHDWGALALDCLNCSMDYPAELVERAHPELVSNVYRDLFPNPFVSLEWNPEWFTSTVRGIATHIYAERDFTTMPILGDALMDAGCDHQLIQDHCRTTKPHARGCWVVDAILDKT